jgi:hypothetical protein
VATLKSSEKGTKRNNIKDEQAFEKTEKKKGRLFLPFFISVFLVLATQIWL